MAGDEQFVFRERSDRRDGAGLEESWRRLGQAQGHPLDRDHMHLFRGPVPGTGDREKSLIKIPVLLSLLVENVDEGKTRREERVWRVWSTDSVTSRENAEINKPWRARNISKTVPCSRRARRPSFIRRGPLVFESFVNDPTTPGHRSFIKRA